MLFATNAFAFYKKALGKYRCASLT